MATCPPGTTLLLARNAHLSAFNAAALAGCAVAWAEPEADAARGIAHCVAPAALVAALARERGRGARVGAVLVVSPTYYGAAARVGGARARGGARPRAPGGAGRWLGGVCCAAAAMRQARTAHTRRRRPPLARARPQSSRPSATPRARP